LFIVLVDELFIVLVDELFIVLVDELFIVLVDEFCQFDISLMVLGSFLPRPE